MPVCYSNLNKYGTEERDVPIIPPKPVYTVFQPFNKIRPHNFNPNSSWNSMNNTRENYVSKPTPVISNNCASNSFRGQFSERSQLNRENKRGYSDF